MTVTFDRHAKLGSGTALNAALDVNPHLAPSPITELHLLYPASLGVTTSDLGLAACRRPAIDFTNVLIDGIGLGGCPRNSVMGYGTATARVELGTLVIPATATITVLAGPLRRGNLELVAYVNGVNPLGFRLAYRGAVSDAKGPYGGDLAITLPTIPELPDVATVTLTRLRLAIGSPAITYIDRGRYYHPDGVTLPERCPRGGLLFRATLSFQDGTTTTTSTRARCPRR